MKAWSCAA